MYNIQGCHNSPNPQLTLDIKVIMEIECLLLIWNWSHDTPDNIAKIEMKDLYSIDQGVYKSSQHEKNAEMAFLFSSQATHDAKSSAV